MQIVINISKKLYDRYKKKDYIKRCDIDEFEKALDRCIILPKGHGDLKDMDDIYEALEGWSDDTGWIVDAIDCQAPTIIEADRSDICRDDK